MTTEQVRKLMGLPKNLRPDEVRGILANIIGRVDRLEERVRKSERTEAPAK